MKNILVMFLALGLLVTSAHLGFAQDAPAADAPPAAAPAAPDATTPPPAEAPAEAAPAPAAPDTTAAPPPADTTTTDTTTTETTHHHHRMPHTASPLPLVGLSGLAAFGSALALRLRRK